jgi:hypothetical protein
MFVAVQDDLRRRPMLFQQLDKVGVSQNGNWNVTSYDPQSVMNYCNNNWNNDGHLSARDIEAVTTIYGAR